MMFIRLYLFLSATAQEASQSHEGVLQDAFEHGDTTESSTLENHENEDLPEHENEEHENEDVYNYDNLNLHDGSNFIIEDHVDEHPGWNFMEDKTSEEQSQQPYIRPTNPTSQRGTSQPAVRPITRPFVSRPQPSRCLNIDQAKASRMIGDILAHLNLANNNMNQLYQMLGLRPSFAPVTNSPGIGNSGNPYNGSPSAGPGFGGRVRPGFGNPGGAGGLGGPGARGPVGPNGRGFGGPGAGPNGRGFGGPGAGPNGRGPGPSARGFGPGAGPGARFGPGGGGNGMRPGRPMTNRPMPNSALNGNGGLNGNRGLGGKSGNGSGYKPY